MALLDDLPCRSPHNRDNHLYDRYIEDDQFNDCDEQSRRVSEHTAVSSIPASLPSDELSYSVRRKTRPPFRSPSSVRAIQLSSPELGSSPRHFHSGSNRQKWLGEVQRNLGDRVISDTESYSEHVDDEALRYMMAHKRQNRNRALQSHSLRTLSTTTMDTVQAPLVLLHITVLPSTLRYSITALESTAPEHVLDNLRILREKLNDIVFARGILITHPGEEYDLLEERLLEALELVTPRISPCGHFLGHETDIGLHDSKGDEESDRSSRIEPWIEQQETCDYAHANILIPCQSSRVSNDDICDVCHERLRQTIGGSEEGVKKWEINFYAANGLMRAGAWTAAWREMERVDVEISPWIPEDVKKSLEHVAREEEEVRTREELEKQKLEHQQRTVKLQQELNAATQRAHQLERDMLELHHEIERSRRVAAIQSPQPPASTTTQLTWSVAPLELTEAQKRELPEVPSTVRLKDDIPLGRLMMRYLWLVAQDKNNLVITGVSVLFLFFSVFLAHSLITKTSPRLPAVVTNATSIVANKSDGINGIHG